MKWKLADLVWLLLYVAMLAAVVGGTFRFRNSVLAVYSGETAQEEWDNWRADAKEMASGDGPVKRREPKSLEPPALVLMRDHFTVCLALSVLLSSVLFGTFTFFLRGALSSQRRLTPDQRRQL